MRLTLRVDTPEGRFSCHSTDFVSELHLVDNYEERFSYHVAHIESESGHAIS